jgi:hypothetical protein
MTNDLTTRTTSGSLALPIPAPDFEAWRITAHLRNGATREAGKLVLAHDRVPTPADRTRLQQRLRSLSTSLAKHDRVAVAAAIGELLGCYRNAFKVGEDPKPVIAKYVSELAAVPTWCVERVCGEMRDAKNEDVAKFPPSTIQVKLACEAYLDRPRQEMREIGEVLTAECGKPPMSAEESARVAAGLRQLADDLKGATGATGDDPIEVLRRYGATDAQLAALPTTMAQATTAKHLNPNIKGAA